MDDFESQEIDAEIDEVLFAVAENLKPEQTNTVDAEPAMESTKVIPLLLHCRLCGILDNDMVDIFSKNILSKIHLCLPVTVKETDTLPKQICWSCLEELDRSYRFHQTVVKAEKQLLAFFDRPVPINLEETSPQCDRQHNGTEDDFNRTSNSASGIESSDNIPTSSSEPAQRAQTSDKTNDRMLRLKPCSVVLSNIAMPGQNRIRATSETKSSSDSELRNSDEIDIEKPQTSGTSIRTVQQSICDSGVGKNSGSRSAAEATQGKETNHEDDPAIQKHYRTPGRYLCTTCGKVYKYKDSLTRHYRLHTGERLHICEYCGKKFVSKANAICHNRIHTGERPFECTICDKRFSFLSNLKEHKAEVHSDKKYYLCSLCDKSFKTSRSRNRHTMLVHTDENERRWQCDYCKKKFTQKHSLVQHIKRCKGQYRSNNVTTV